MPSKASAKAGRDERLVDIDGPLKEKSARAKDLVKEWLGTALKAGNICSKLEEVSGRERQPLKQELRGYRNWMCSVENDFRREYFVLDTINQDGSPNRRFFESFTLIVGRNHLSCAIKISKEGDVLFDVDWDRSTLVQSSDLET